MGEVEDEVVDGFFNLDFHNKIKSVNVSLKFDSKIKFAT